MDDPHIRHRGMIQRQPCDGGAVAVPAPPLRFSAVARDESAPAPALGEHTESVLGELLGLGVDELTAMHDDGVI